jgi:preprotein translocase subunit SecF
MDWLKYRKIYAAVSLTLIIVGAFSLIKWRLKLAVDFRGGAIVEYRISKDVSTQKLTKKIRKAGIEVYSITSTAENSYLFKFPPISPQEKKEVKKALESFGVEVEELRFETVGPSIGPELIKKTVYAILISTSAILIWVAIQFKSFKFGVSAILAMLHDSFILIGSFSLLGYFLDVEVDFLFVTALLITLSFSVHDTIVVFDRIREIDKRQGGDFKEIANQALTETMVRSLNNSFTIVFMLVALLLLGGTTIKWFAVALLIGTILGTYSSPFVAVPILITWDEVQKRLKK